MAAVKTWGIKRCSPLRQTLWNLRKVFNLISLFKSVAFTFIHIQWDINLKKLRFFHFFFSPKLHLFFCRIIAINKMLHLDQLWYCQPISLQIKVREKILKNKITFFSIVSTWNISAKHSSKLWISVNPYGLSELYAFSAITAALGRRQHSVIFGAGQITELFLQFLAQ